MSENKRPRKRWPSRLIVVGLLVSGALVMGWPVGTTLVNNHQTSTTTKDFVADLDKLRKSEPAKLDSELAEARAYNAALPAAALYDPWGNQPAEGNQLTYLETMDEPMARLRIPKVSVDVLVHHGTSDEVLFEGAGHLFGSSLPVGGVDTHAVIAAHNSYPMHTYFDRIHELQNGDEFTIDVLGETLTYRVDQTRIVEPWELENVARENGQDLVTLVTCIYPETGGQKRLLVRGVRVASSEILDDGAAAFAAESAPVLSDLSIQSWMWPRVIGDALVALLLVLMTIGWIRQDRRVDANRRKETANEL